MNKFKDQNVLKLTADLLLHYISSLDIGAAPVRSFTDKLTRITDEQIRNAYRIKHIQNFGREVDLYCVLPQKKLIIQIEIKDGKSCMSNYLLDKELII